MQNTLNTQKSNFSDVAVSAHSKVTSAIRKNDLGTSTKSCSNIDIKQEKVSSDYDKRQSHRSYVYALRDRASDILHEPKKLLKEQHRVCACTNLINKNLVQITVLKLQLFQTCCKQWRN